MVSEVLRTIMSSRYQTLAGTHHHYAYSDPQTFSSSGELLHPLPTVAWDPPPSKSVQIRQIWKVAERGAERSVGQELWDGEVGFSVKNISRNIMRGIALGSETRLEGHTCIVT